MFDTLLESRAGRSGSAGGALASVTAHSALIAAAVLATAQASVKVTKPVETNHVVYFPRPPLVLPVRSATTSVTDRKPVLPKPIQVSIPGSHFAPLDLRSLTSLAGEVASPEIPTGTSAGRAGAVALDPSGVFQESEVETPASLISGNASPRYPETLRSAGIQGSVVALFVVDEGGRAEVDSVRFVRSDNRLFEDAVRVALRRMQFVPAETGGRKVRQLVQMPFVFTLNR